MDPRRNPFSPGAGSRPPELAGREKIVEEGEIALGRVKDGLSAQSQILLGLRGVGKTVLLNEIDRLADEEGYYTSFIEAPENGKFIEMLVPLMEQLLKKLSTYQNARDLARQGAAALRNFASIFKLKLGELEVGVEPTPGVADSGNLGVDLTELFLMIGEAAKRAERAWALLIDEVQYLTEEELAALIVALHRINQKGLPIIMFAAGLPQMAKIAGDTKSYAERLFAYPPVGALDPKAAQEAIRNPIVKKGETIDDDALAEIVNVTNGYPFFLQVWAHHAWRIADQSPIDLGDVKRCTDAAREDLDSGFFRVRLDRLSPAEVDYVHAMARLGNGPFKSTDVAKELGRTPKSMGPRRDIIIKKGMIYSPSYGDVDFTVPLFGDFLRRQAAS